MIVMLLNVVFVELIHPQLFVMELLWGVEKIFSPKKKLPIILLLIVDLLLEKMLLISSFEERTLFFNKEMINLFFS